MTVARSTKHRKAAEADPWVRRRHSRWTPGRVRMQCNGSRGQLRRPPPLPLCLPWRPAARLLRRCPCPATNDCIASVRNRTQLPRTEVMHAIAASRGATLLLPTGPSGPPGLRPSLNQLPPRRPRGCASTRRCLPPLTLRRLGSGRLVSVRQLWRACSGRHTDTSGAG